jgi:hypothetical protein
MADIFLSYARADKTRASEFAAALSQHGWTVFWDPEIFAGADWSETIETELRGSGCVVILWSSAAAKSKWVRVEAGYGLERDCLIPVALDETPPPLAFRPIEIAQLQDWTGPDREHPEFQGLVRGITHRIGTKPTSPASNVATREAGRGRLYLALATTFVIVSVGSALSLSGWGPWRAVSDSPDIPAQDRSLSPTPPPSSTTTQPTRTATSDESARDPPRTETPDTCKSQTAELKAVEIEEQGAQLVPKSQIPSLDQQMQDLTEPLEHAKSELNRINALYQDGAVTFSRLETAKRIVKELVDQHHALKDKAADYRAQVARSEARIRAAKLRATNACS